MSDILDDDHKEAFQQALEGVKAEKTQNHQQHDEDPTPDDLQPAEPKPIEEHEQHPSEHRRSNSEQDYGIEDAGKPPKPKDPVQVRPPVRAGSKSSLQRNGKPSPSKVSSRKASNSNGVVRRVVALVAAFQNLVSNMTQSMSKNPLAMLRFILFLVALLLALSRRDVKERVKRITGSGWDKVRSTIGMGVKVSYI